jgi:hypothetical protein
VAESEALVAVVKTTTRSHGWAGLRNTGANGRLIQGIVVKVIKRDSSCRMRP